MTIYNNIYFGAIVPRTLYANVIDKEYDGTNIAYISFINLANNDIISYTATYTGIDVGKYLVNLTISGSNTSYYNLFSDTLSGYIIQKPLLFYGSKIYDGTTNITLSISGLVINQQIIYTANFIDSNAGLNKSLNLTISGIYDFMNMVNIPLNNYLILNNTNIYPKTISIYSTQNKTYDKTTTTYITLSGIIYPDIVTFYANFIDSNAGINKLINVTLSNNVINYVLDISSNFATIYSKTLTVLTQNKTYNRMTTAYITLSGIIYPDIVNCDANFIDYNVGINKQININFTENINNYLNDIKSVAILSKFNSDISAQTIGVFDISNNKKYQFQYLYNNQNNLLNIGLNIVTNKTGNFLLNGKLINTLSNTNTGHVSLNTNILPGNNLFDFELNSANNTINIPGNPWAFYSASSYIGNALIDLTGNNRYAYFYGNGNDITIGSGSGNGATAPIDYITGTTGSLFTFPGGSIPTQFTYCSLTRYNGGSNQRILSSHTINLIHGHHKNKSGVAYYSKWNTQLQVSNTQDWLNFCGGNSPNISPPYNFISNGNYTGQANGGTGNNGFLTINSNQYGENSDYQFSVLLIYNRWLTQDELLQASNFLQNYLLTGNLFNTINLQVSVKDNSSNQTLFETDLNWKYSIESINYNSNNNYQLTNNYIGDIYSKTFNILPQKLHI
jgi:hypothetical protein